MSMAFCEYLKVFMKLFLDDFSVLNNLSMHLVKLWLCFDKCQKLNINLNPKKCLFLVYSKVILRQKNFNHCKYAYTKNTKGHTNLQWDLPMFHQELYFHYSSDHKTFKQNKGV